MGAQCVCVCVCVYVCVCMGRGGAYIHLPNGEVYPSTHWVSCVWPLSVKQEKVLWVLATLMHKPQYDLRLGLGSGSGLGLGFSHAQAAA